ncbi:hypothetical protein [Photobacterium leiognathi]|uniref:hypothetical protein n=1 Tax=Photobacterium leiognathi TaxID=553611 RepID=UPI00298136C0|nr:hypothetical protein [Photobacterium leiognathi]
MKSDPKALYSHSFNYGNDGSEDSKRAAEKAMKQDIYTRNIRAYYSQDSSESKAVSKAKRSKDELDAKYAKYEAAHKS